MQGGKDTIICILQGKLWVDVGTLMTLNVNADSLLATFTEASKMAEIRTKKLLFGKKLNFDV